MDSDMLQSFVTSVSMKLDCPSFMAQWWCPEPPRLKYYRQSGFLPSGHYCTVFGSMYKSGPMAYG